MCAFICWAYENEIIILYQSKLSRCFQDHERITFLHLQISKRKEMRVYEQINWSKILIILLASEKDIFVFIRIIITISWYNIHIFTYKENLALSKPTWEQNPWPDLPRDFGSANAVDGWYENRGPTGGQCTISNEGYYTAMWRVDLESVVSISHITIYYRTDNQSMLHFIQLIK